jgi:integrase
MSCVSLIQVFSDAARAELCVSSMINLNREWAAEPYTTMVFVAVWTGLRVSELIGLKWRRIHADSITVEERFCRPDWSVPKTTKNFTRKHPLPPPRNTMARAY